MLKRDTDVQRRDVPERLQIAMQSMGLRVEKYGDFSPEQRLEEAEWIVIQAEDAIVSPCDRLALSLIHI